MPARGFVCSVPLPAAASARACTEIECAHAQVLGVVGALDPHKHKTNQADLQGEGKLEAEGVRPQRQGPAATHAGTVAHTLGTCGPPASIRCSAQAVAQAHNQLGRPARGG